MSQGGIYQLVVRDERHDQFLQASKELRRRLGAIKAKRAAERARLYAAGTPEWERYSTEPTFGDVECTHFLPVHRNYRPFANTSSQYVKTLPQGTSKLGGSGGVADFTLPIYGDFIGDMVLHVRIAAVGDAAGSTLYRYTPYPGIRLIRRGILRSDQVTVDDFTRDEVLMFDKLWVRPDSRPGWDRCNGQQVEQSADFAGNNITGVLKYKDGPQTARPAQPALDMWIPMQFMTFRDASQSLPNEMVPNTQRIVTLELAGLSELIQATDSAGDVVPLPFSEVDAALEMYVNNIFVNPEIHDIFTSRLGFALVRVHRRQTETVTAPAGRIRLDRVKYPAEYLQLAFRRAGALAEFDTWHLFGVQAARTDANALLAPAAVYNALLGICQLVCRQATDTTSLAPAVTSVGVRARDIELLPRVNPVFYNGYLPLRWRDQTHAQTPRDVGALLLPFDLYPGDAQQTGYLNLSVEREVYVDYESVASRANPLEALVTVAAINFLIRDGDSFRLRYST